MNVVFDLDGTLIDSRARMYALYRRLVPATTLDFDTYWLHKRAKVPHKDLLQRQEGYGEQQVYVFIKHWMELIETPELLAMDTNFHGVPEALGRLRPHASLHVCTARQMRQPVLGQLEQLGLLQNFSSVLATEENHKSKAELITAQLSNLSCRDWMIGDTGKDIELGKQLGMRTCAVLSGFLSRESLLPYGPDRILESAAYFELTG